MDYLDTRGRTQLFDFDSFHYAFFELKLLMKRHKLAQVTQYFFFFTAVCHVKVNRISPFHNFLRISVSFVFQTRRNAYVRGIIFLLLTTIYSTRDSTDIRAIKSDHDHFGYVPAYKCGRVK